MQRWTSLVLTNLGVIKCYLFIFIFIFLRYWLGKREWYQLSLLQNGKLTAATLLTKVSPEYYATRIKRFVVVIFVRFSSTPVRMVLAVSSCRSFAPLSLLFCFLYCWGIVSPSQQWHQEAQSKNEDESQKDQLHLRKRHPPILFSSYGNWFTIKNITRLLKRFFFRSIQMSLHENSSDQSYQRTKWPLLLGN